MVSDISDYGYSRLSQRIWLVVVLDREGGGGGEHGNNTNYNTIKHFKKL